MIVESRSDLRSIQSNQHCPLNRKESISSICYPAYPKPTRPRTSKSKISTDSYFPPQPLPCSKCTIAFRNPFTDGAPIDNDPSRHSHECKCISPKSSISLSKNSFPTSIEDSEEFIRLFDNDPDARAKRKSSNNPFLDPAAAPANPFIDPNPTPTSISPPVSLYTPSIVSNVSLNEENEKVYPAQPLHSHEVDIKSSSDYIYPSYDTVEDPRRYLTSKEIRYQRSFFIGVVLLMNLNLAIAAFIGHVGKMVLVFMILIKSKDVLSCIIQAIGLPIRYFRKRIWGEKEITSKVILSLIPAYSESEEQIVKTIFSLRDNGCEPHWQVMCVILDGKPRDIKKHMTRHVASFARKFETIKNTIGELNIIAGFLEDVPVIVLEKVKNAGKKDSLVLCHDLFNYPRDNMPEHSRVLRRELWDTIIPKLVEGRDFKGFDYVFCTDADSTIHHGALAALTNVLIRDPKAIAACGLVLVEFEPGLEWSVWNLYQQFQYCFGQFVRRGAEGLIGKVTCLPGCITMITVRPEMAGAMKKYAAPVTRFEVIHHQVQYLGTDRRLTYSMLSQDKGLRTLFEPAAVSETVAPQSLRHYLSQRRRWGSNAYFNNYYYLFGEKMIAWTRAAAFIEVLRLTMVYYRVVNTAMFIRGMVTSFAFMEIMPLLIVAEIPLVWFIFYTLVLNKMLRRRSGKLALGWFINKFMSCFISVTVFSLVARNLGLQVWGMSGVTASSATATTTAGTTIDEKADSAEPFNAADRLEKAEGMDRMDRAPSIL